MTTTSGPVTNLQGHTVHIGRRQRARFWAAAMAALALCVGGTTAELRAPEKAHADSLADHAVDWAASKEGSTAWDGWCLQFVHDAYAAAGKDIGGAPSAWEYWKQHPSQQRTTGEPVRGSLVFWGPTDGNPYGHVALAIGDGRAWSTAERSWNGVHWLTISYRSQTKPYAGYLVP